MNWQLITILCCNMIFIDSSERMVRTGESLSCWLTTSFIWSDMANRISAADLYEVSSILLSMASKLISRVLTFFSNDIKLVYFDKGNDPQQSQFVTLKHTKITVSLYMVSNAFAMFCARAEAFTAISRCAPRRRQAILVIFELHWPRAMAFLNLQCSETAQYILDCLSSYLNQFHLT